MQCSCGGMMTERDVVRDGNIHGKYNHCKGCGKVHWFFMTNRLKEELNWRSAYTLGCNELYGDDVPDYIAGYQRYMDNV